MTFDVIVGYAVHTEGQPLRQFTSFDDAVKAAGEDDHIHILIEAKEELDLFVCSCGTKQLPIKTGEWYRCPTCGML